MAIFKNFYNFHQNNLEQLNVHGWINKYPTTARKTVFLALVGYFLIHPCIMHLKKVFQPKIYLEYFFYFGVKIKKLNFPTVIFFMYCDTEKI